MNSRLSRAGWLIAYSSSSKPVETICLRCQWRLATSLSRPRPLSSSTPVCQRRQNGTTSSPGADGGPEAVDDAQTSVFRRIKSRHSPADLPERPKRVFRSKGERLLAKEESLEIGILGQPAHAIVMKNQGAWQSRRLEQRDELDAGKEDVDLAETMKGEGKVATLEEAYSNLDELCPGQGAILSQGAFDALRETLASGFTTAQLKGYMRPRARKAESPQGTAKHPPWVLEYSPWRPSRFDESQEAADPLLLGYISRNMSPKQKLAVSLMRQCWALNITDIQSEPGHLALRLRNAEFDLLMLNRDIWLQILSRSSVQEGRQVSVTRSQQLIGISAPKAIAETVVHNINDSLRALVTDHIDTSTITSSRIERDILDELGRISKTHVAYDPVQPQHLLVSWMPSSNIQDPDIESKLDIVFRLLLTAFAANDRSSSSVSVNPLQQQSGWIVPDDDADKRSWETRSGHWGRWIDATATASIDSAKDIAPIPATILKHPFRLLPMQEPQPEPANEQSGVTNTPHGWSRMPLQLTTATFGYTLHPYSIMPSAGLVQPITAPPTTTARLFTPVIPPFSNLARFPDQFGSHPSGIILMHLLPKPSSSSAAPPLELRLDLDSAGSDATITHVRALAAVHTADILQPRSAVDVRVRQQAFFQLDGTAAVPPPLLDFVSRSHLALAAGQLHTPPRANAVPLPRRLLLPLDQVADGAAATPAALAGGQVEEEDVVAVDYVFAGLELRYPVATLCDGWRLVYTVIEGGKSRGSRAELTLESIAPAEGEDISPSASAGEYSAQDFMATVSKLANDTTLWFK